MTTDEIKAAIEADEKEIGLRRVHIRGLKRLLRKRERYDEECKAVANGPATEAE